MAVDRIHTLSACIQYRSRKNSRTLNNAGSIPDRVKYENRPTPCLEWNATLGTCNATTADSIPDPRGERDLSQSLPLPSRVQQIHDRERRMHLRGVTESANPPLSRDYIPFARFAPSSSPRLLRIESSFCSDFHLFVASILNFPRGEREEGETILSILFQFWCANAKEWCRKGSEKETSVFNIYSSRIFLWQVE